MGFRRSLDPYPPPPTPRLPQPEFIPIPLAPPLIPRPPLLRLADLYFSVDATIAVVNSDVGAAEVLQYTVQL